MEFAKLRYFAGKKNMSKLIMLRFCKFTVLLFHLSTLLKFSIAFAVMTGEKLESGKIIQAAIVIPMENDKTSNRNPTPVAVPNILPNIKMFNPKVIVEEPCQQKNASRRAFNCSSSLPPDVSSKAKYCGSNSRLVGENCLCNVGYRKFPFSDVCVKKNGQGCLFRKNDCNTDLTNMACINNVCSCEDSDIYDPITSRCVGRVAGLCYPGIKDCTSNAECVNVPTTANRVFRRNASPSHSSAGYYFYQTEQLPLTEYIVSSGSDIELSGRCQCKEGFVESHSGLCKKAYGETCTSADECDNLHLVCNEGLCACPDALHVYDILSRSCVALVGAKCSNEPGGTLCVKFAFCEKINLKIDGKCVCVEDAVESNIRTCVKEMSNEKEQEHASSRILFSY